MQGCYNVEKLLRNLHRRFATVFLLADIFYILYLPLGKHMENYFLNFWNTNVKTILVIFINFDYVLVAT